MGLTKIPLAYLPHPHDIIRKLLADDYASHIVLLESGSEYSEKSRYTILAWGSRKDVTAWSEDNPSSVYRSLKSLLKESDSDVRPFGSRPVLGYMSYEANTLIEPHLRDYVKDWGKCPLLEFHLPEVVVIYDRLLGRAVMRGLSREELMHIVKDCENVELQDFRVDDVLSYVPRERYIEWVSSSLDRIRNGEIFQIVLSRYINVTYQGEPFTAYVRLVSLNPSPYQFYVRFGKRIIFGSSPELLVSVKDDKAETYPIAGTRPRGSTPEDDIRLEDELLSSEKDFAEHIMLVDLARNDLGKICRFGTVKVSELMFVEKYSHVQHLVTRVEGVLMPGLDIVDALWATFPAGTVSGAPKPRAMELIFHYEDRARGPYAGCVGLASRKGGEFAITIRSIYVVDGVATLQAGAGIVYDSVPELEYLETEYKLAALKLCVGMKPEVR